VSGVVGDWHRSEERAPTNGPRELNFRDSATAKPCSPKYLGVEGKCPKNEVEELPKMPRLEEMFRRAVLTLAFLEPVLGMYLSGMFSRAGFGVRALLHFP
jgi:hypothetical protein